MWAAQRVRCNSPHQWITSGGAGTMGFGLPSAVGAQFGRPDAKVLAIAGDGGFQMTMSELATVRRCKLPIKILIMDNKYLGMVRQWQELFFQQRYSGVDLSDNPDFAALARVYGLEAFTLSEESAIDETIAKWWNCPGPALLHALCQLEENVFPMVPAGAGLSDMVESA
jgi:acetolactate synthase-1/2/3 large subunit